VIESGRSDTIVGIATPPGTGAIGVIRVSGPLAVPTVSRIVRVGGPSGLGACTSRVLHVATLIDPTTGGELDRALVVRMPGPASYTGEDVVEISCHGNPVLLREIVDRLVSDGARLAEPGEFTRRAYLNRRMDLLQVEAIAELIAARTERAIRNAARQLRGTLAAEVGALRERLLDVMAGLEASLDFPDEGVGPSDLESLKQLTELQGSLDSFVVKARQGRAVQDGLTVVLVGAPNVGKSSLLNRLLGAERAIVSPMPGTTRDLVDGTVVIHGVPVRLVDGAGLGVAQDAVDAEGMWRIRQVVGDSDLALVILDLSRPPARADWEVLELTAKGERLVIGNKSDLASVSQATMVAECRCSALTGEGMAAIEKLLGNWVQQQTAADGEEGAVVASMRVIDSLRAAREAVDKAAGSLGRVPVEAALVDLGQAKRELDRIMGRMEEDGAVLDLIFSKFCIGK